MLWTLLLCLYERWMLCLLICFLLILCKRLFACMSVSVTVVSTFPFNVVYTFIMLVWEVNVMSVCMFPLNVVYPFVVVIWGVNVTDVCMLCIRLLCLYERWMLWVHVCRTFVAFQVRPAANPIFRSLQLYSLVTCCRFKGTLATWLCNVPLWGSRYAPLLIIYPVHFALLLFCYVSLLQRCDAYLSLMSV